MKIVINTCFGGFGLSKWALDRMGIPYDDNGLYDMDDVKRTDPALIAVVEENAEAASGAYAELEVVEIPDNTTDWFIDEYDGAEDVIYVVNGKIYRKG